MDWGDCLESEESQKAEKCSKKSVAWQAILLGDIWPHETLATFYGKRDFG